MSLGKSRVLNSPRSAEYEVGRRTHILGVFYSMPLDRFVHTPADGQIALLTTASLVQIFVSAFALQLDEADQC